jgi:ribosomal protein L29
MFQQSTGSSEIHSKLQDSEIWKDLLDYSNDEIIEMLDHELHTLMELRIKKHGATLENYQSILRVMPTLRQRSFFVYIFMSKKDYR